MRLILIVICIGFLLLGGCAGDATKTQGSGAKQIQTRTLSFRQHNLTLFVEIANTTTQINQGLMMRGSLGEKSGMLFDMGRMSRQSFWMYRTLIPLDAIFMDEQMRVVDIIQMEPCAEKNASKCVQYAPKTDMRHILEVNGGSALKWGIKEGEKAELD